MLQAADIKVLGSLSRDDLKKLCGDNFPEWVSFPQYEQVSALIPPTYQNSPSRSSNLGYYRPRKKEFVCLRGLNVKCGYLQKQTVGGICMSHIVLLTQAAIFFALDSKSLNHETEDVH